MVRICFGAGNTGQWTWGRSFFLATQSGSEMDLVMILGGKKIGFEFKYASVPKKTGSMTISKKDLQLEHVYVVYPEGERYFLSENIEVISLAEMIGELQVIV